MKTILFSAILFLGIQSEILSQQYITPQQLGLHIHKGNIDKSKMSLKMRDTVVIDMFNYEDDFFDIAVLYKSKNEVVVYKNCINGSITDYKTIKLSKDASKIENDSPSERDLLFNPNLKAGIKITYSDKTSERISNYRINKTSDEPISKAPVRNFLDDAGVFVYDISFIEVWRSGRNGSLARELPIGDIDNDGINEMIFTFWPVSDSIPINFPTRIVVFETIGNNQFRIDWDTTLSQGGYNQLSYITDFDRDGNKEFFGAGWSHFIGSDFSIGIYECSGPGKYKFRDYEGCICGQLQDVVVIDTTHYNVNPGNSGMWILNSHSQATRIQLKIFSQKNPWFYSFQSVFNANDIQLGGYVYDFDAFDIDNDGKTEILIGDTQFGTNYIGYLDSTGMGFPIMQGYEFKEIIPNAPVSSGWLLGKDFDNDNKKEIITCGIGSGSGSIGVVKHTGSPGQNQFTTMWWDGTPWAGPNYRIDSNRIDNFYSVLFPNVRSSGFMFWQNTHIFKYSGLYNFEKVFYEETDSFAFVGPRMTDVDGNGKINIISGAGIGLPSTKAYLINLEQQGAIGIQNVSTEVPQSFELHQNYPNPFNGTTKIKFDINTIGNYNIRVFEITGRLVEEILNKQIPPGSFEIVYNANNLSSGVYFYKLSSDKFSQTRKFLLIK